MFCVSNDSFPYPVSYLLPERFSFQLIERELKWIWVGQWYGDINMHLFDGLENFSVRR